MSRITLSRLDTAGWQCVWLGGVRETGGHDSLLWSRGDKMRARKTDQKEAYDGNRLSRKPELEDRDFRSDVEANAEQVADAPANVEPAVV